MTISLITGLSTRKRSFIKYVEFHLVRTSWISFVYVDVAFLSSLLTTTLALNKVTTALTFEIRPNKSGTALIDFSAINLIICAKQGILYCFQPLIQWLLIYWLHHQLQLLWHFLFVYSTCFENQLGTVHYFFLKCRFKWNLIIVKSTGLKVVSAVVLVDTTYSSIERKMIIFTMLYVKPI